MAKQFILSNTTFILLCLALPALMSFLVVGEGSVSELSAYKARKYRVDATRLALRMVSEDADYDKAEAELPDDLVESIFHALRAVHLSNLDEAALVTRTHRLHTFPVPNVDRFFVVYKRDIPWAVPLRMGDFTTDNEEINNLCEKFGLIIENNVEWDEDHNSFHIRAERSLNISPIARAFMGIEGITLVDMLTPNGDGNDIELKETHQGWELKYIVKFGACITGCKNQHAWSFSVSNTGNVEFVEESGDALPDWMSDDD